MKLNWVSCGDGCRALIPCGKFEGQSQTKPPCVWMCFEIREIWTEQNLLCREKHVPSLISYPGTLTKVSRFSKWITHRLRLFELANFISCRVRNKISSLRFNKFGFLCCHNALRFEPAKSSTVLMGFNLKLLPILPVNHGSVNVSWKGQNHARFLNFFVQNHPERKIEKILGWIFP